MLEYGHKIEERVKIMQTEIKENIQGTKSDGKEPRTQINDLEQKEEVSTQLEQNEETRIQKMRRGLGTSGTTLFEQIMKENYPNLAKEMDFQEVQEVQETQRVPKKLDQRRNTTRHIIITLPKIKEKERILKAAREKETITYKGVPIKTVS